MAAFHHNAELSCPPAGWWMRSLVTSLLIWSGISMAAEPPAPTVDELKAAVVYQITRFVEWPEGQSTNAPLVVGLVGDGPFITALEKMLANAKPVQGRPLTIQRLAPNLSPLEAAQVKILVLSGRLQERTMSTILKAVADSGALTISDSNDFCRKGGMVGLREVDKRVQLEVNLEACERARLRLSSRLLRQAKIVAGNPSVLQK